MPRLRPFSVPHPPTPTPPPLICTQTQPGRGGLVEGVHPPSPSAFAPWSSRRLVYFSHAPRRLPAWLSNTKILLAMARKSARRRQTVISLTIDSGCTSGLVDLEACPSIVTLPLTRSLSYRWVPARNRCSPPSIAPSLSYVTDGPPVLHLSLERAAMFRWW